MHGKKQRERKDAKYYAEMKETVTNATDNELKKLNSDYHHGINMDIRMGCKISDATRKVDKLIEDEMHKRGFQSCDDLEEDIWFAQRTHCI